MSKRLRDIIPLDEIKLSRLTTALDKGHPIGTVSYERPELSGEKKAAAKAAMHSALDRESKKGMISWTGAHAGRYKYDANSEPDKENSYVLRPGDHPKAKENFHRIISHLAKRFGQESFLKVKKHGQGPTPTGAYYYPGRHGSSKKVAPLGKIHYNEPLKGGGGDTKIKGSSSSFTVREDEK